MQAFVPVDIHTKPYIKAWVIFCLGPNPKLTAESPSVGSNIGAKLFDVLQHKTNERKKRITNTGYTALLRIYIPLATFKKFGQNLNETNLRSFNLFIEREVKHRFHYLIKDMMEEFPSFENNIQEVRRKLGITADDWCTSSMKKEYYRNRKQIKK